MKIAVIDNYDSFVYNIVRYLEEVSNEKIIVFRNDEIDYEQLKSVDGILLSPGPGIPSEAGSLLDVISNFHENKSILGVCLGHQAIAEFFGGSLAQDSLPQHGKASMIEHLNNSEIFKNVPTKTEVGRYHSWSVNEELPDSLRVTASTKSGHVMAIQHEEHKLYGVQFHPESIMTPFGRTMINNWINTLKKKRK